MEVYKMKFMTSTRRNRLLGAVVAALSSLVFAAPSLAQLSDSGTIKVPDTLQLPRHFVEQLLRHPDQVQRQLYALQQLEALDVDGNGVSRGDLDKLALQQQAQTRAQMLSQFMIHDHDADGIVTQKEMESGLQWQMRRHGQSGNDSAAARLRMKQMVARSMEPFVKADKDGDGKLTVPEIYAYFDADEDVQRRMSRRRLRGGLAEAIMNLDFDGNGTVTEDEVLAAVAKLGPEVLTDPASAPVRVVEPGCELPPVEKADKLILLGGYEGSALANMTALGQDTETTAAELFIESGDEPLFIVAATHEGVLFKADGATDRIRKLVLISGHASSSGTSGSGVSGIDKSKVSFLNGGRRCLEYFHEVAGMKGVKAKASLRNLVGREPDALLGSYTLGSVILPQGPIDKKTVRHRPPRETAENRSLLRFSPSGVMEFERADLVTQVPAEKYEVLPQEAGILQLLKEGKIENMGRDNYRIKQKIRFPAGLNGAHRVHFLLPKGVPEPDGHPGHSCVFSEATGAPLGRGHCN